jgi:hypothetical protein
LKACASPGFPNEGAAPHGPRDQGDRHHHPAVDPRPRQGGEWNETTFTCATGLAIAGFISVAGAQSTGGRLPQIAYLGVLSPSVLDPRPIAAFRHGLVENGLIDGRNVRVDYNCQESPYC